MQVTAETIAGASTLRYGFQGITNAVASTPPGIPDGTFINSATIDANTIAITTPTVSNSFIELTGLSASLTKGTAYAMVIRPDTNWTAGYTLTVRAAMTGTAEVNNVTWYHVNGATAGTGTPCYGIGTATDWYGMPAPFTTPANTLATTAGSNNNQIGVEFSLPATFTSYKIRGWWVPGLRVGFTTDVGMTVKILDAANTVLQSVTYNTNNARSTQTAFPHWFEFTDTLATLTGGTTYYLVVETANASNNSMLGFSINDSYKAPWTTIPHRVVYRNSNTGAWLTTTAPETTLMQSDLILEDVTTSSSGSAGLDIPLGMTGGMRG